MRAEHAMQTPRAHAQSPGCTFESPLPELHRVERSHRERGKVSVLRKIAAQSTRIVRITPPFVTRLRIVEACSDRCGEVQAKAPDGPPAVCIVRVIRKLMPNTRRCVHEHRASILALAQELLLRNCGGVEHLK